MDSVFIQKADALQYCEEKKTEFDFYHLRSCKLKIDGEIITCKVASKSFDHISQEGILDLLSEKITAQLA